MRAETEEVVPQEGVGGKALTFAFYSPMVMAGRGKRETGDSGSIAFGLSRAGSPVKYSDDCGGRGVEYG